LELGTRINNRFNHIERGIIVQFHLPLKSWHFIEMLTIACPHAPCVGRHI
jgi:hypothetical protein